MAIKTEIAWTDSTFNPWIGCTKVGPGCDHCYAEREFDHRHGRAKWGAGNPRQRTSEHNWNNPLRWERKHAEFYAEHGRPRRVFCASLADVFDNEAPQQWREDLWQLIEATPNLNWQILTKRIGNVHQMIPDRWSLSLPPNVWLGITVTNQEEADRDIPKLLSIKTHTRFLSMEPLLGPVDLNDIPWTKPRATFPVTDDISDGRSALYPVNGTCIDWVIVGGESGPNARPMQPEWVRDLRKQCARASTPFFFKQWGGEREKGGCFLSGQEIKQWPKPAPHRAV